MNPPDIGRNVTDAYDTQRSEVELQEILHYAGPVRATISKECFVVVHMDKLLAQMSANPWFNTLDVKNRCALLSASRRVRVPAGAFVFHQGDAQSGFFGLASGVLKASSLREDGKEAILAVLEAGDWFGEATAIDGLPRALDVTALTTAELLLVDQKRFDKLMLHPDFARAIAVLQAAHIRAAYAGLEDARLRSTRAQIARRLLRLAQGDVAMQTPARQTIAITHDRLALMLGITRQTLALELKLMAAEGAVALGYGRLEIESLDKLRAAALEAGGGRHPRSLPIRRRARDETGNLPHVSRSSRRRNTNKAQLGNCPDESPRAPACARRHFS